MYSVTYTIAKAIIEEGKTNQVKLLFEVDGEKARPKDIKEQAVSILRILLEKGSL